MMRWFRFVLLLFCLMVLDAGNLLNWIAIPRSYVRPDVLLVFLVFLVCHLERTEAILASFLIGLAADVSSQTPVMGPYTISFGVFGSLLGQLHSVFLMRRMVFRGLAIFVVAVLVRGLAVMLMLLRDSASAPSLHTMVWGTAVYSGVVGPVLWMALSPLAGWLGIREGPRYGLRPPRR